MNRPQLQTILWLRWRLTANRARRGGVVNMVLISVLLWIAVCTGVGLFLTALIAGTLLLPQANSQIVLLIWDGVVAAYLFSWMIELTVELQRGELLSLDKLLHLPASLFDVFLLNYVGSWLSFTHLIFLPAMLGLAAAMVLAKGLPQLVLAPALLGFLLLTTAAAYQFRGWLATLMSNPRRRRTIVAVVTLGIVLIAQLPQTVHLVIWRHKDAAADDQRKLQELTAAWQQGKVSSTDYVARSGELNTRIAERRKAQTQETFAAVTKAARLANACLPIGWLPLAADAASRGSAWPGLLGAAGTCLLAAVSLRRAYRTTMRHVTQAEGTAVPVAPSPSPAPSPNPAPAAAARRPCVERRLPWVSEQTAAVAWAEFQSYARAPEVRLLALSPLLLVIGAGVFMYFSGAARAAAPLRPLIALGVVVMALLPLMQLYCNQFGVDRCGFRAFVLSCVPRPRIVLGKNLALAPLSLAPALVGVVVVGFLSPLPIGQLAATLLQVPILFLVLCLVGNLASILAPFPVAGGTLKPAAGVGVKVLLNALFSLIIPLAAVPSLALLGLELLLDQVRAAPALPLYFFGALVELLVLVWLYRYSLGPAGALLHRREHQILDAVTAGVE